VVDFHRAGVGGAASMQAARFTRSLFDLSGRVACCFWPGLDGIVRDDGDCGMVVWRIEGFRGARTALTLFLVQLAFNALWTCLFFAWHLGGPGICRHPGSLAFDRGDADQLLAHPAARRRIAHSYLLCG